MNMRRMILSALFATAAFGLSATQSSAGGYGYGGHAQHAQYGGNGGHYQKQCHWERQHVRIWDETYHRWTWVWQRVHICR
jgi:hypothetical protein